MWSISAQCPSVCVPPGHRVEAEGTRVNPKDLVRAGYDIISQAYRSDDTEDGQEVSWLEELSTSIPPGARILDLGCGNGIPAARWLTTRG